MDKLDKKERNKAFKEWALKVKERDNWGCVICGKKERLNAHHIIPRGVTAHRFDIDNGISLCPGHHRFNMCISPHKNALAFFMWMEENRPFILAKLKYTIKKQY